MRRQLGPSQTTERAGHKPFDGVFEQAPTKTSAQPVALASCTLSVQEIEGGEYTEDPLLTIEGPAAQPGALPVSLSIPPSLTVSPLPTLHAAPQKAPFCFARAVADALGMCGLSTFGAYRAPHLSQAALLGVATMATARGAADLIHKAETFWRRGHLDEARAFALLFLATGQEVAGFNVCDYLSRDTIESLDGDCRQVLERKWRTRPAGPVRDLVMGAGAQWHPPPAALAVWNELLELRDGGLIHHAAVKALLAGCADLTELHRRALRADAKTCTAIWAEAGRFHREKQADGGRCMGLVFLMTGRVPPDRGHGPALADLITQAFVVGLGDAFDPPLSLKWF